MVGNAEGVRRLEVDAVVADRLVLSESPRPRASLNPGDSSSAGTSMLNGKSMSCVDTSTVIMWLRTASTPYSSSSSSSSLSSLRRPSGPGLEPNAARRGLLPPEEMFGSEELKRREREDCRC
jgi:hypothetical protein